MACFGMNKFLGLAVAFSICLSSFGFVPTNSETASPQQTRLIVGYLAGEGLPIKEIENRGAAERLTHLVYAFANIADGRPVLADEENEYKRPYSAAESVDGKADDPADKHALRGLFNQLRKLKVHHPQLTLLMSIGGASQANSKGFSLASRTESSRQKFVAACLDLFIRGNLPQGISAKGVFAGLDIDWEYPTDCSAGMKGGEGCVPEDTANFTLLLSDFRRQLDEQGRKDDVHYQLTMAGSAWVDDYSKYEWPKIHPLLDFINVMTYGLAPPGKTRPHSPLYQSSTETGKWSSTFNTDYAVKRYLAEGVPANKIIMGVPFYAMGWEGVPDVNNGLYQKPGSEPLAAPYSKLKNLKGFRLFRDTETRALWIFNPQTGVFWSFDDPDSLSVKMDYVRRMQLGGVMFWELSGDDENSSLLKAIYRGLRQ
jgi:chitinase